MSSSRDTLINTSIEESIKVKQALLADPQLLKQINDVIGEFVTALSNGHKLLLFDLGGAIAVVCMAAMAMLTTVRHTAQLYCEEPLS